MRLSTPPDDPMPFARGLFGLSLDGFTNWDLHPDSIPHQAPPAGLCNTTRPADESTAHDPYVHFERKRRAPEGTRRLGTFARGVSAQMSDT